MSIRNLYLLACSALLLAGCAPEREQTISISGSSTIAPLMTEIGQRFETRHPGVRVDVQSGGTSRGIQDVRGGLAAIGMVSRALNADERDLTAHAIARDGIAMIVHADNPLKMPKCRLKSPMNSKCSVKRVSLSMRQVLPQTGKIRPVSMWWCLSSTKALAAPGMLPR